MERRGVVPKSMSEGGRGMSDYGHVLSRSWFDLVRPPLLLYPADQRIYRQDEQVPAAGEVHSTNRHVGAAQATVLLLLGGWERQLDANLFFFRQVDGMDGVIDGFDGYPLSQASLFIDYWYSASCICKSTNSTYPTAPCST